MKHLFGQKFCRGDAKNMGFLLILKSYVSWWEHPKVIPHSFNCIHVTYLSFELTYFRVIKRNKFRHVIWWGLKLFNFNETGLGSLRATLDTGVVSISLYYVLINMDHFLTKLVYDVHSINRYDGVQIYMKHTIEYIKLIGCDLPGVR